MPKTPPSAGHRTVQVDNLGATSNDILRVAAAFKRGVSETFLSSFILSTDKTKVVVNGRDIQTPQAP